MKNVTQFAPIEFNSHSLDCAAKSTQIISTL